MKRLFCLLLVPVLLFASCASKPEAEILTMDEIITLSEKGMSLSWEDFENFDYEDVGSGRYILEFPMVEPEYSLSIQGNSLKEPPAQILLSNEEGDSIEIRVDDIEAFLAGELDEEPSSVPEPERKPEPNKPAPPVSSAPSGGAASSSSQSKPAQPTYKIVAAPASYDVSAASITVQITNTSQVEGGYGYMYRIERKVKKIGRLCRLILML